MEPEKNNEMDLLLKSLARSGRALSTKMSVSSEHLDADELNSYAEDVLPALARARCTEHLAECDRCRGIIARLAQPVPLPREVAIEQRKESTFWQSVAAFFSPAVLRYAVPALGLAAVITVTLVALRQQEQSTDYVARNEPAASATPSEDSKQAEGLANQSNSSADTISETKAGESQSASEEVEKKKLEDQKLTVVPPAEKYGTAVATPAEVAAVQPREAPAPGTYSAEPASAPPPKPTVTDSDTVSTYRIEKRAEVETENRQRDDVNPDPRNEPTHGPSRSNIPLAGRRTQGILADRGGPRAKSKKDGADEVDEQVVAGKQFRRQGGAWVDTSYSPRATINVARGSEQFRALIADEPGLRAITNQLGGEVIVVWKGKAYRFR